MGQMTTEVYKQNVKSVYKMTAFLSAVTIGEVFLALYYEFSLIPKGAPRLFLTLIVAFASLIKAYGIMSIFMHLGHEKKGFILTVLLPFIFLIWGIIAFSMEGSYWGMYMKNFVENVAGGYL